MYQGALQTKQLYNDIASIVVCKMYTNDMTEDVIRKNFFNRNGLLLIIEDFITPDNIK